MRDVAVRPNETLPGLERPLDRDESLRKACREFESVFTNELLKNMRRTVEKCDLFHGGQGEEIYESLLDQELSKKMAGMGPQSLANLLYRQFRRATQDEAPEGADVGLWREPRGAAPLSPVSEGQVSSVFGWRKDPITGVEQFHHGVDVAAPEGTPVLAPEQGKVVTSGFSKGYGHFILLDHGRGVTTLYAHNQENKVKEGEWVKRGGLLATVGSTGRSTGPHLHFEVRRKGAAQDPNVFLSANRRRI